MSNLKYIPKYTFADYKIWKGDWELIEGHPVSMSPSPVRKHQDLVGLIYSHFLNVLSNKTKDCNCRIYLELDWKVKNDTVLRPDLLMVCDDNFDTDFIETVPSIIVEVLSPSTHLRDRNTKFNIYEENGVPYYVIVNPDSKKVEIFQLIDNRYKEVQITEFKIKKDCIVPVDFDSIFR